MKRIILNISRERGLTTEAPVAMRPDSRGRPNGESKTTTWNFERGKKGGSWCTCDCGIGF